MEKVLPTSWEHFCELTGRDPIASLPNVSQLDEKTAGRLIADHKLAAMILFCNGGKLPDYTDSSTWKHEPWWEVVKDKKKPSGRGLSYHGCDYWSTGTCVGPRFAFLEEEDLLHIVKHFLELYEALYL